MNLKLKHSPHFLRLLQLDPGISIALAGDDALKILAESKYAIVDGTFELVELKLVLTTVMGYHDGIAVPCAYYLSELKTRESYLLFFRVCTSPTQSYSYLVVHVSFLQKIKELTKGRMDPTGCLMDFEEALGSAWEDVFPNCSIMRDLFHFQQANRRKMIKIGQDALKGELKKDIQVLWYADTKPQLDNHLKEFLAKWDDQSPEFSSYFRRVWMGQHPPHTWASYSRPKDAPSGLFFVCTMRFLLLTIDEGSGSIEGHHNRIQNNILESCGSRTAVDQFVDKLWEEDTLHMRTITTPQLWSDKKKEHLAARTRHLKAKRITLKDISGSRTISHHNSTFSSSSSSATVTTTTTTNTTATNTTTFGSSNNDDGDSDTDMDLEVSPSDTAAAKPTPSSSNSVDTPPLHPFFSSSKALPTSTLLPPRLDIPADERCTCGQKTKNRKCTLHRCKECCIKKESSSQSNNGKTFCPALRCTSWCCGPPRCSHEGRQSDLHCLYQPRSKREEGEEDQTVRVDPLWGSIQGPLLY